MSHPARQGGRDLPRGVERPRGDLRRRASSHRAGHRRRHASPPDGHQERDSNSIEPGHRSAQVNLFRGAGQEKTVQSTVDPQTRQLLPGRRRPAGGQPLTCQIRVRVLAIRSCQNIWQSTHTALLVLVKTKRPSFSAPLQGSSLPNEASCFHLRFHSGTQRQANCSLGKTLRRVAPTPIRERGLPRHRAGRSRRYPAATPEFPCRRRNDH
jgi:hypothetical protein